MKKFLTILLSFVMVFTMMPTMTGVAFAGNTSNCTDCNHEAKIGDVHYDTFAEAVNAVQSGQTITLLKTLNLSENVSFLDNIAIALNGHKINRNGHSFTVGSNFAFEIASEADLSNANTFFTGTTGTYTLKLANDITITQEFFNNDDFLNIVLDGNGHKITAVVSEPSLERSEQYALYFQSNQDGEEKKVTITNLKLEVQDGFRSGIQLQTGDNNTGVLSATLENVTVTMNHTVAPRKDNKDKTCVPIQNNRAYVTVKKALNIATDKFCWAAFDLTGKATDKQATLTFDNDGEDKATVAFSDSRTFDQKVKEPLIGTENLSYVSFTNLEAMGLMYVEKTSPTEPTKTKYGYDMPAAELNGEKYLSFKAALDSAESGDTITLLSDTILGARTGVKENVTVDLNGFDVDNNNGANSLLVGADFTILVSSEKDMITAEKLAHQSEKRSFIWKVKDSFTVNNPIQISTVCPITIDGNSKTITAKNETQGIASQTHAISFVNSTESSKNVVIKNLVLNLSNGFRSGMLFHNSSASIDAELNGVNIVANRTTAPKNSSIEETTGTLIQNNACKVSVKNNFSLTTDKYCWNAIDIDAKLKEASVIFENEGENKVEANFTDNREATYKAAEPFVGTSATGAGNLNKVSVSNADTVGLYESTRETKYGYDLPVCVVNNQQFGSVSKAITYAGATKSVIKMLTDSTEDVTIESNQDITINLNGQVLKGTGIASVITNKGALTITDTNITTEHYFAYATDTNWSYVSNPTIEQKNNAITVDDITNTTAKDTVIKVLGGLITGGGTSESSTLHCGGGINNNGTSAVLNIFGGSIIGNKVSQTTEHKYSYGGGILNKQGRVSMSSGAIIGNAAIATNTPGDSSGGAISNRGGELNISDNALLAFNYAQYGGAICNEDATTYANTTITGGTIKMNTASFGAGVYVSYGPVSILGGNIEGNNGAGVYVENIKSSSLTIGGDAVVDGNKQPGSSTEQNVYVAKEGDNAVITYLPRISTECPLAAGAKIGLSSKAGAGITTKNGSSNDLKYITSDVSGSELICINGHLSFVTKYEISNEDDIETALNGAQNQVWDLKEDLTISKEISFEKNIRIIGNGHTITAALGEGTIKHMMNFASTKNVQFVEIENLKLVSSNNTKHIMCVQASEAAGHGLDVVLRNVSFDQTNGMEAGGAPLINNGCTVSVFEEFSITTGENSWYAINLDSQKGSAALHFDDNAKVTFTDYRLGTSQVKNPWIKFDNHDTVSEEEQKNYPDSNKTTVTGNVVSSSLTTKYEKSTLTGYELKVDPKLNADVVYNLGTETDLNAVVTAIQNGADDNRVILNITKDLTISNKSYSIAKKGIQLIINGNGNTITAKKTGDLCDYVFNFTSKRSNPTSVIINDLNLIVCDGYRNGIQAQTEENKRKMDLTLNNVNITMEHKTVPYAEQKYKYCAPIVNNDSDITLSGACTITTDFACWSAADLTSRYDAHNASLIISGTNIKFTDNRSAAKKVEEPLVKLAVKTDGTANVINYQNANLVTATNGYNLQVYAVGSDEKVVGNEAAKEKAETTAKEIIEKLASKTSNFNGTAIDKASSQSIINVLGDDGYVDVQLVSVGFEEKATDVEGTTQITRFTFNVTPYNSEHEVQHNLDNAITFRLPVVVSGFGLANIHHGEDFIGQVSIEGTSDNRYVEVKASSFSEYSYELTNTTYNPGNAVHYENAAENNPTVLADSGATYELSNNGSTLTITVKEGYELVGVTVNGISKGTLTILTGLEDGDKVVITSQIKKEEAANAISKLKIRANTKYVTKNGKKAVQVYTTVIEGKSALQNLLNDGYTAKYEFYRSIGTKVNSFKKVYTSKNDKYSNTKGIKGKRYYYRAVLKVYDKEGNLVASTALKNCKYGTRVFK